MRGEPTVGNRASDDFPGARRPRGPVAAIGQHVLEHPGHRFLIVLAVFAALAWIAWIVHQRTSAAFADAHAGYLYALLEPRAVALDDWAELNPDPNARASALETLRADLRQLDSNAPGTVTVIFDERGAMITSVPRGERLAIPIERALAQVGNGNGSVRRGVLDTPYVNIVGREVVSAWQWLPAARLGVVVEVPPERVAGSMRYVERGMPIALALFVVLGGIATWTGLALAAMHREGRHFGPYRLEGKIEEGGMATVYRGVHARLKRPSAIKVLKPHLATEELIARFEREVMLTSRLEHPATVEIFDYGRTRDGTFYFAMEYIDGLTLAQLVERDGPQPAARVAHVLKQVCESLREAHAKGLVHRDVKPQNIMLCERGGESDVVKVVDWGLIKDTRSDDTRGLTRYARMLGTPAYMPPERVRQPSQADPLVDIYGLGAVAYYVLTGERLFDAPNDFDLQRLVLEVQPPPVSQKAKQPIPAALDELIARCLEKEPAKRPQSVDELIGVFSALLAERPWTQTEARERWSRWRLEMSAATR